MPERVPAGVLPLAPRRRLRGRPLQRLQGLLLQVSVRAVVMIAGVVFFSIITNSTTTFRVRHILQESLHSPLLFSSLTLLFSLSASGEKVHCEGRCSQPLAKGMCRASFKRFFYNASADQCQEFIFGGCLGNDNNFVSMEECRSECQNTGKSSLLCSSFCCAFNLFFVICDIYIYICIHYFRVFARNGNEDSKINKRKRLRKTDKQDKPQTPPKNASSPPPSLQTSAASRCRRACARAARRAGTTTWRRASASPSCTAAAEGTGTTSAPRTSASHAAQVRREEVVTTLLFLLLLFTVNCHLLLFIIVLLYIFIRLTISYLFYGVSYFLLYLYTLSYLHGKGREVILLLE